MPESGIFPQTPFDEEKMSPSETNTSSASSEVESPVVAMVHGDLEKTASQATEKPSQAGSPAQRAVTAQDWNGKDDPGNPLNWPMRWKVYTIVMVGLQCFTITFGSSVITPAVREIAEQFNISVYTAILPLTLYVLGLGFGPVLSAPVSETFGRRVVYLALFPPSLLFTIGSGFAKSFATLLVCRFLAGTLGSGCLAVGAGTNGDIWSHKHRASASGIFLLAPFLGPAFGPAVGGYVTMTKGWRWTQWTVLFVGAFTFLFSLPQRETYKKIILQKRAKQLNLPPPPNQLPPGLARIKILLLVTLLRPMRMMVTESIVAFLSIYTAFNFSVLFAFFAAFPLVFESPYPEIQVYHFNPGEGGLVFLAIGLGVVLAAGVYIVIDRLYYQAKLAKRIAAGDVTNLPPEERLPAAMLGSMLLPIGLFWFAWTARSDIHWIVPIIGTIPFGAGNMLVFCSTINYLIDTYGGIYGASAAAANGMLRYMTGAVFPLFTIQMYRTLGVGPASSLLGGVMVLCCPIPWVLWKWGAKVRERSAYIT